MEGGDHAETGQEGAGDALAARDAPPARAGPGGAAGPGGGAGWRVHLSAGLRHVADGLLKADRGRGSFPALPGPPRQLEVSDRGGAEEAAAFQEPRPGGEPERWRELPAAARRPWLESWLAAELATLFRQPVAALGPTRPLTALGLDSILAIELQHAIETRLGAAIGLADILEGPTIGQLAERIAAQELPEGATRNDEAVLAPAPPRAGGYPLSHNQRALWFLQRLQPDSTAYNVTAAARVEPALEMATLRRALDLLASRHHALKLAFAESAAGPVQWVQPEGGVELTEEQVDGDGDGARQLASCLQAAASRPFALEREPPLRIAVVHGPADVLILSAHHIVVDLWSLAVLVHDLGSLYSQLRRGAPAGPAAVPALAYTDYVLWQERSLAGPRGEELWRYWNHELDGAPAVSELPADRPRPPRQTWRGGRRTRWLPPDLLARLHVLARGHDSTLYVTLMAALVTLLYRHNGREDLLVGSPVAGRPAAGLAEMVGLFVNSVVLRSRVAGGLAFGDLLGQVRQTALGAFAHQDYPFPLLVERLQPVRDPSFSPLFQVMFTVQRAQLPGTEELALFALGEPGARLDFPEISLVSLPIAHGAAQFDLDLDAVESRRGLGLALTYNSDLFDAISVERLLQRFETLLRSAVAAPALPLCDLRLLTAGEHHQLLCEWNDTASRRDRGACFHRLFEHRAQRAPDAVAAVCGDRAMTYGALNAAANRLARGLLAAGLRAEDRVALWAERGLDFLAAMIATWKAGGAYLPLDPRQPARRLAHLVRTGGARLVLASRACHGLAAAALAAAGDPGPPPPPVLPLARLLAAERSAADLPAGPLAEQLAYVLFTSGSTGAPKAVMIEHDAMLNHLWLMTVQLPLSAADRVAQTATPVFDISIWQFLSALLVGGSVHIVSDATAGDPVQLAAEIADRGISVLQAVPTLLWALVQDGEAGVAAALAALRWLLPTGEALPPELCRRWFARFAGVPLLNAYGPAECADDVSFQVLREAPAPAAPRMPIGRPVLNLRLHLLDRDLGLLPAGMPGELFVAGAGVGRGYLDDPARTAAAFVPDPYGPESGSRLYRSGDLCVRRPDGALEFLGRSDSQVKVRGVRIELGEIESALGAHPDVGQAVVVAHQDTDAAGKRLTAYFTAAGAAAVTPAELRQFLKESLPEAMIPGAIVRLAAMPLTPNGKIDRRSLPAPDGAAEKGAASRPPRDEIERLLTGVFAQVLEKPDVGVEDDFFACGGHSLLATRVVARLRQGLGVDLPLHVFFAEPTAAGLAAEVRRRQRDGQPGGTLPPLVRRASGGAPPLSFGQQRLWFLNQLQPDSPTYNMPGTVRLRGRLSVPGLAATLRAIVGRHEALRTVFRSADGVPCQEILPAAEPALPLLDLAPLPASAGASAARSLAEQDSLRPFDLARWPLFRAMLLRLAADDHLLVITLHHIVSDGWSLGVLISELSAGYGALSRGRPPRLPELTVQYADFAGWQREWLQGERLEAQLAYWRDQLSGEQPVLELPLDRPRPARQTHRGARRALRVTGTGALELARLARGEASTPFMGLLALFAACLQRHTGQASIRIGSPIANRQLAELERLIGFFVNTLVMRIDLAADPSLVMLLRAVRQTALAAYAHQDVPFERLVDELQPRRDLARSPLFQAMFVLQNAPAPRLDLAGLALDLAELDNGTAKFDLTLSLEEVGGELHGWIEFNRDLFDPATIERFGHHFRRLLAAAVERPGEPLAALPLLGAAERAQLVSEWNDTHAEPAEPAPVHRLFEVQARLRPHAVAVSAAGLHLTYAELNDRANRLALTLCAAGARPDATVAILAGRGPETIAGLLGILKAGGAYMPLDARQPRDRLAAMLHDSRAPLVVVEEGLAGLLPAHQARVVPLRAAPGHGTAIAAVPVLPENLAYTLFTSGSTGRPKGVQIPHRALTNLLVAMARPPLALGGRTVLSVTTFSFDIAAVEIFLPLTTGGRVVLADHDATLDGGRLAAAVEAAGATMLQATPTTWHMLAESGWRGNAGLAGITGGEALSPELAQRLGPRLSVLWNMYGPTETAVYSTLQRIDGGGTRIPIGRPLASTAVHVLDRNGLPVPIGVAGEVCIAGCGVARGYAGRTDLTAERFIPDPFAGAPGGRLYRTGDLAARRTDGGIVYLGRIDHQVKLRGFRIELAEIEAGLELHPEVERAVVVMRDDGPRPQAGGDGRRLVAYLVARRPEAAGAGELLALLRQRLPDYMLPAAFTWLDALPLTPGGKIDRRSLPAPAGEPAREPLLAAPRDPVAEILQGIFASVLERPDVGLDADFFALGGHSLLATRVVSRINAAFGLDLPVRSLFETPTVAALARSVAAARPGRSRRPPLKRVPRSQRSQHGQPLALSFSQERLWVVDRLAPDDPVFNVFQALRVTGPLAAATLSRSLAEVVRRHESLRTRFGTVRGRPVQLIDTASRFALARIDLTGLTGASGERETDRLIHAEARRPFRLARGPLIRCSLLLCRGGHHVLLLTLHHIVCDDWSIGLLVREVAALYAAFAHGLPSPLPELALQFADFAQWQRDWLQGEALAEEIAHWRGRLGGDLPVLALPTDRPRPAVLSFRGAVLPVRLDAAVVTGLRQLGSREGATTFMCLAAAFAAALGRLSGQEDIILGTAVSGRNAPEAEAIIGLFVNVLALRIDLAGTPTWRQLLARVRAAALDAYSHQDLPFEKLVEALKLPRDASRAALRQAGLSMLETSMQPIVLGDDVAAQPLPVDLGVARLDLTLFVWRSGDGLEGVCEYSTDLFDAATVSRFLDLFTRLLAEMSLDPERRPAAAAPLLVPPPLSRPPGDDPARHRENPAL